MPGIVLGTGDTALNRVKALVMVLLLRACYGKKNRKVLHDAVAWVCGPLPDKGGQLRLSEQ